MLYWIIISSSSVSVQRDRQTDTHTYTETDAAKPNTCFINNANIIIIIIIIIKTIKLQTVYLLTWVNRVNIVHLETRHIIRGTTRQTDRETNTFTERQWCWHVAPSVHNVMSYTDTHIHIRAGIHRHTDTDRYTMFTVSSTLIWAVLTGPADWVVTLGPLCHA